MKYTRVVSLTLLFVILSFGVAFGQEKVTIVAPSTKAAEGLDLKAVSELFKDSKNLEEFEKALNDPDTGVNNLDLDGDGDVDFIRVVEEVAEDTHVIILQVPLGENEFQDVATIEVEKTGEEAYNMQVRGNEVMYGANYYFAPVDVHIHAWPAIVWIYRPAYHPYRSAFLFGVYPRWWRRHHPVAVAVYHTRTVRLTGRNAFTHVRVGRVMTVHKVRYKAHSSPRVKARVEHKKSARERNGKGRRR